MRPHDDERVRVFTRDPSDDVVPLGRIADVYLQGVRIEHVAEACGALIRSAWETLRPVSNLGAPADREILDLGVRRSRRLLDVPLQLRDHLARTARWPPCKCNAFP